MLTAARACAAPINTACLRRTALARRPQAPLLFVPHRAYRRLGHGAAFAVAATPLIVVLDMDECLIHSTDWLEGGGPFQSQGGPDGPPTVRHAEVDSYQVTFNQGVSCTVLKRKGVDMFLSACCASFETYVFTAGQQAYADAVLDKLDSEGKLAGRFYRADCMCVGRHGSRPGAELFLKDLTAVARRAGRIDEDLSRVVLVDNNPVSFVCQPSNGIPVPDFVGEPDDALGEVLRLLHNLNASDSDVRPVLQKLFGLEALLSSVRARLLPQGSKCALANIGKL
mmetsp:Transcript_79601/g.221480  ORF Transcript_79601/g.221480 Transcript_79601/m.221480 type:complete len:282 (-) Transcript_79601:100-945(-)